MKRCDLPVVKLMSKFGLDAFLYRDTEYYDYGHGETQEATYEPYGKMRSEKT